MKILSFDVGIKNLSYCYLESIGDNTTKILHWDNLCVTDKNCTKISLDELTPCVLSTLLEHFDDTFSADIVLIENQPMLKNGLMKTVAVLIYSYFNLSKLQFGNYNEIKFISATNKLKCRKVPKESDVKSYKNRKKLSVEISRAYIGDISAERLEWFDSHKKADDISDSLLQGIYYIEFVLKHVVASAAPVAAIQT